MLSQELEETLRRAVDLASSKGHELATLEHLLVALTEDSDALEVLAACAVDIDKLREELLQHLEETLSAIAVGAMEAKPTTSFHRVLQRAVIHTQSSGHEQATGANVLIALFAEQESHAVWALQQQDMSRLDAVTYVSHGIAKNENFNANATPDGAEVSSDEVNAKENALATYAVDLIEKAKSGKIDPLIGRSAEVDRTIQVYAGGQRITRFWWVIAVLVKLRLQKVWPRKLMTAKCLKFWLKRRSILLIWVRFWPVRAIAVTLKNA